MGLTVATDEDMFHEGISTVIAANANIISMCKAIKNTIKNNQINVHMSNLFSKKGQHSLYIYSTLYCSSSVAMHFENYRNLCLSINLWKVPPSVAMTDLLLAAWRGCLLLDIKPQLVEICNTKCITVFSIWPSSG